MVEDGRLSSSPAAEMPPLAPISFEDLAGYEEASRVLQRNRTLYSRPTFWRREWKVMLLSKLEDDDETEEGEASEQEASDEKECEESHEEWLDSTMSSAPSTLVYSDDSDDEDPGFIEDLDYHQACTKLLIGLLRKAKKKGEEFASCGQTLLTVWDRTGIKDAKIEKPAEVAAFLAALTKYATVEHLPVLSRLIYKLLEDKSMVNTLSSVLVDILKNSAVDASQVVIYAVSNIAQCARWIRAPFVECLAEVHELLEDKQQQKRLRFLASTLYFAFDPLDWRLRNLLTHEFTKIVATIDDPKIIEAEFTDMGQVLVKERAFDNRLDLCYLLAVTMSRLVEFQDMDRAKRFASLLETQMLHSEDHRCRFAFATVCGFLLREFMISDADFDKILGDNFFIFLPHDQVNTVRGKFLWGLDRPNASALFGVAHRLHPIKRTLKIIARVDSSQVNREIADQILSEAASKAKEEFCTRLEVDVENHDPLCIERLYEDSDASAESDDAGIDFDDLKEEQASPEILSTKNMCKRIMTELPTF